MRMSGIRIGAIAALSVAFRAAPALACSFEGPAQYELDAQEQQLDTTAPAAPTAVVATVREGEGEERVGCGQFASDSCADLGWLQVEFAPPGDDRTASDDLGYIVEIEGDVPDGLAQVVPDDDAFEFSAYPMSFVWIDEDPDRDEPYDFTVRLYAVDRGGNVSEGSPPFRVRSEGESGCAMVAADVASRSFGALAVGLGLIAMRRRRTQR
jgi:hypothetical protein